MSLPWQHAQPANVFFYVIMDDMPILLGGAPTERWVNPLPVEEKLSGNQKKRPTLWVFFFLAAYDRCCPLVITCKVRHGQIELNILW